MPRVLAKMALDMRTSENTRVPEITLVKYKVTMIAAIINRIMRSVVPMFFFMIFLFIIN